jgi:hypothetical protein
VSKRTSFEYSLLRRMHGDNSGAATLGSNKLDFLRYIEYELNLEALRVKRKARLGTPLLPACLLACMSAVQSTFGLIWVCVRDRFDQNQRL